MFGVKGVVFCFTYGFLTGVLVSEASFSRGREVAPAGFQSSVVSVLSPVDFTERGQGVLDQAAFETVLEFKKEAGFSYKVVENEFSSRSVFELCPECLSGDKTADEIKLLSVAACEQIVRGEQCQGVDPKYLRNCKEEEEDPLAFGQRVLGCVKGSAIEGAIGLGAGLVLGKVILGIGALLSVPVVGPALGIVAGGGAALYIYSEYDRAYQEVAPGDGRALRATGKLLGEVGTGAYRLLLGNYECYSSEGRAWEVCGLLLGGALGGKMVVRTTAKKSAKKKASKDSKPSENDAARAEAEAAIHERAAVRAEAMADEARERLNKARQQRLQRGRRKGGSSLIDDWNELFRHYDD